VRGFTTYNEVFPRLIRKKLGISLVFVCFLTSERYMALFQTVVLNKCIKELEVLPIVSCEAILHASLEFAAFSTFAPVLGACGIKDRNSE